jgi:hypothetical protein
MRVLLLFGRGIEMRIVHLLIIASIASVLSAILVGCIYVLLLVTDTYPDTLMVATGCLFTLGFVLSIAALLGIFITRTCWLGLIPVVLAFVISGSVVYVIVDMERSVRARSSP